MPHNIAAVDIGAESGRVFLARYDGERLSLSEVYRFANRRVRVRGHLHWNVLGLWENIVAGIAAARDAGGELDGVGVDTWAVDYGLLDGPGFLLGPPYHYRDQRTQGMIEAVEQRAPREQIYARTGIQFLPINTLYQLAAHRRMQPKLIDYADQFLLMPDLFHYWLSGERTSERTNATTTQLWSVPEGRWAPDMFEAIDVPLSLAPSVVEPGTRLGLVLPQLRDDLGENVQVVAPATHDTAAAVAAVPAAPSNRWAYISSGTWSLVGLELPGPLVGRDALAGNFTNEGGVFGTVRFLKNVMGLWLLQECRRIWEKDGDSVPYEALFASAEAAPPFGALIDPDDASFLAPDDMPRAIEQYVIERGGSVFADRGALVRCILESLVLRYRQVIEMAAQLAGVQVETIHVVGGGARSSLMNQWLADATGLPVVVGPVEATALGNALMQLVAFGELRSLADVRAVARRSVETTTFEPDLSQQVAWDEAQL